MRTFIRTTKNERRHCRSLFALILLLFFSAAIHAQTGITNHEATRESIRTAGEWTQQAGEDLSHGKMLLAFNHHLLAIKSLLPGDSLPPDYLEFSYQTHCRMLSLVDTLLEKYYYGDSRTLLIRHVQAVYERAVHLAFLLYRQTSSEKYFREAFLLSEKNRNLYLAENMRRSGALGGVPPAITARTEKFSALAFIYRSLLDAENKKAHPDNEYIRKYSDSLNDATEHLDSLHALIKQEYPIYHRFIRTGITADAYTIEKSLTGTKNAVIEYYQTQRALFMFVFSPSGKAFVRIPAGSSFDSLVTAFQQSILKGDRHTFAPAAFRLSELIFSPALPLLEGCTHVRIIPDGRLALIPFDCLLKTMPGPETGYSGFDYLLKHYCFSYSPGAAMLAENKKNKAGLGNTSLLAIAPVFSQDVKKKYMECGPPTDPVYMALSEQRWSLRLSEKLKQQYHGECLLKSQATASAFRLRAPQAGILHIASHTFADTASPMHTRIAFIKEGCDTSGANGYIYLRDIYGMRIRASLSVLGSCNTGFGTYSRGEGMISLAHAFSYAGCPALVYSLWEVDEKTTADLLEEFYRGIHKGLNKDDALRAAKLSLLKKNEEHLSNPYYWAGFVFSGNDEALQFDRPAKYTGVFYVLGIVAISAVIAFMAQRRIRKSSIKQ